ncbi:NADPH:quinone reductase [Pseudomonas thivervalensis]|uniref:NADPH:quinone reductase n=1 Tax=Pseudomonas thivervalensis TaxID=86265 RepID=UPI003D6C46BC
MKAAYYEKQGSAQDVLVVANVAEPVPCFGEVRVRLHASGLNPSDIKARTGFSAGMPYKRVIPHQDGAGVIDRVGEGVSVDRVGQRVWVYEAQQGSPNGTAAEYVVVPTHKAIELPEGVGMEVGASLGIPALTAHRCLLSDGNIRGKRVLVHGGAGSVGTAAILLAKWAGAWVATTVSNASQAAVALAAGADLVIDRHRENAADVVGRATDSQGVDRIVDVDLMANMTTNLACSSPGAVVSAYALQQSTDVLAVPILEAMKKGIVFRFIYIYNVPQSEKRKAIQAITECLTAGAYAPKIGMRVGLNDIIKAHEAMEASQVVGKIIIDLPSDHD